MTQQHPIVILFQQAELLAGVGLIEAGFCALCEVEELKNGNGMMLYHSRIIDAVSY